ncbi:PREDICTED: SH3 domain-binding glutamic acid-rich protein homolog isoform X2 [Ceratosolen solmsi marchali]|uniref:SH3 domain-binding glutamic acid-rich protein homolog isoform X2 n=1 Tax=Ceratosolen solmsi marchali TaxID=326594 RepID=A0AAJ6YXM2_9HYME|nr:PREDICTED: SH3 domain-binding glutamic acid-rich protein homolog isoform X2 [Ceratosolen solmsi marchali]
MVIKVYISGISGNKEVKKRQQRVLMILESKNVEYEVIDITEPGKEAEKEFMQLNGMAKESKYPLPPQIFNDEDYCGDYEDFDEANEMDELEKFLKGAVNSNDENTENKSQSSDIHQNGNSSSREPSADKDPAETLAKGAEERRVPEGDNDKSSDNVKRSGSETEIKDLSEDLDLEKNDDANDDATTENQENEE